MATTWNRILHVHDRDPARFDTSGEDLEALIMEWQSSVTDQLTKSSRHYTDIHALDDDDDDDNNNNHNNNDDDDNDNESIGSVYEDEGSDEDSLDEEGQGVLDEAGEDTPAAIPPDVQGAKRKALENLGLAHDLECGKSEEDMLLSQVISLVGLKPDHIAFIKRNKRRKIKLASEPIEESISAGPNKEAVDPETQQPRFTWPNHDPVVDELWDDFVERLVQASNGQIDPSRLSKPTGPGESLLAFFWHYPTNAVDVLVWGMIMSRSNPSIGQQVRKFGMPRDIYTHDLYPFRSKGGTTDDDRAIQFGKETFDSMLQICIDYLLAMMSIQNMLWACQLRNKPRIFSNSQTTTNDSQ